MRFFLIVALLASVLLPSGTAPSSEEIHVCAVPGEMYCIACVEQGTDMPCMRGWDRCAGAGTPSVIVCISEEPEP